MELDENLQKYFKIFEAAPTEGKASDGKSVPLYFLWMMIGQDNFLSVTTSPLYVLEHYLFWICSTASVAYNNDKFKWTRKTERSQAPAPTKI